MPRVNSFDVQAEIWTHHQNGLSGQNYFGQIIFGWNLCIKTRSQQSYLENNARETGSDEARKKAGAWGLCLHPARSASTILKVKYFTNRSNPWSLRVISRKLKVPSHNYRARYQAGSEGKARSRRKTRHLSDKMVVRRLKSKHLIYNKWRNFVSVDEAWCICDVWIDGARCLMSFAEKRARKAGGKFVYRSIHVALCSSQESAPLVPLLSVLSLPTQK